MSTHRARRGRRATLTARFATACALGVVLAPITAVQSASAYEPCPTHDVPAGGISDWVTTWPQEKERAGGVTLCYARGTWFGKGWLTIVDMDDGARLRLHTEKTDPDPDDPYHRQEFTKRTAEDWYRFIRTSTRSPYDIPSPGQLFSTINASFFKDSVNDNPTALPFPQKTSSSVNTMGVATLDDTDPDHHAPKRYLGFGSPAGYIPTQDVSIGAWDTYYSWSSHFFAFSFYYPNDALVSFAPNHEMGGESRRTYVGVLGRKVYIFTSEKAYTSNQANEIMMQIKPGVSVIQLDGGGSTQMYSEYGQLDSSIPDVWPLADRKIPDTIAVYTAAD